MKIKHIPKKSGGTRVVVVQNNAEKSDKRYIAWELTRIILTHPESRVIHGFMPGRSPVTNASAHVGYQFTLSVDLKDFFDHCTLRRLEPMVKDPHLARLACPAINGRQYAAQGLSSSPAAANLVAIPMDQTLLAICEWAAAVYTRYADDLTFSGNDLSTLLEIRKALPDVAKTHGQEVNGKKTRIQAASQGRRIITGIAVDSDGIHPTRSVKRRLRAARNNHFYRSEKGLEEWSNLRPPKLGKITKCQETWALANAKAALDD